MNIHLILKEGDEDLIYLRNFLPQKSFGKFINKVIEAERTGRQVFFDIDYEPFKTESGYLDLRLAIKGRENIAFVRALPSRKRTIVIKELIRKQIKIRQDEETEMMELDREEQRVAEEYEKLRLQIKQNHQQKDFVNLFLKVEIYVFHIFSRDFRTEIRTPLFNSLNENSKSPYLMTAD